MPNHYKEIKEEYPGLWDEKEEPIYKKPQKKERTMSVLSEGVEIGEDLKMRKMKGVKRGFGIIFEKKM